jgi:uncharacterized protein (DUF1684 family)
MSALELLDWRRRVAAIYAEVRATADPAAAHRRWQDARNELLATHPQSPVPSAERPGFTGVPVAPYDPGLRFEAVVEPSAEPLRIEVHTGTDGVVPFERAGVVRLPGVGTLDVWWLASYGGGIFVPVRDTRDDGRTYPGGRYVLDTVKGADLGGHDDMLVVDFNFAYNPSCAYDPAWACPLPPPGNVVPVPVTAGELIR